ncbi:MAG: alpha/beta fold hydrolase [Chitinophagales bacterium]|nr:alpha/beta fold hydrolase [Chitinophagales bacterium]
MNLEVNYHPAPQRSSATPLLFVHGMAHAAWCWEWEFVPYFNRLGYDCYTMSLRGHGKSEGREHKRWYRIRDYLTDVEAVVASITPKPVLIGHSMGGFIIQKYVLKHQNLPAAITLASVPAGGMWRGSLKIAAHFPWAFLKGNLTMSTAPFSANTRIIRKIAFSPDADEALLENVKNHMEPESYMAYLDMLFLDLHRPQKISIPLLFLYAARDFVVDYPGWKATADGFGAEQQVVPDVAHDMFLDTRWHMTAERIAHWLKKINI